MTLVVSRFDENGRLFTVTDSKFTYDQEYKFNTPYKPSIILNKNLILTPRINVAYAGIKNDASTLLNKFYKQYKHLDIHIPYEEVISLVKHVHDSENHRTDFIIGFIDQDDTQKLIKISNGIIHENQSAAWIGDNKGFAKFQNAYHAYKEEENGFSIKLFDCMNEVILSQEIESVGGYPIMSCVSTTTLKDTKTNERKDFNFFQYIMFSQGHGGFQPQHIEANTVTKLEFGNASDGGYDLSYFVSKNINYSAFCVCTGIGNIATLVCPQLFGTDCMVKEFDDFEELKHSIKVTYNLDLDGIYIDSNGSIRKF